MEWLNYEVYQFRGRIARWGLLVGGGASVFVGHLYAACWGYVEEVVVGITGEHIGKCLVFILGIHISNKLFLQWNTCFSLARETQTEYPGTSKHCSNSFKDFVDRRGAELFTVVFGVRDIHTI